MLLLKVLQEVERHHIPDRIPSMAQKSQAIEGVATMAVSPPYQQPSSTPNTSQIKVTVHRRSVLATTPATTATVLTASLLKALKKKANTHLNPSPAP